MFIAVYLSREPSGQESRKAFPKTGRARRTVKGDNAEDEDKRQNQDDNGVDLEAGALIGVETEHGAARATSASGARAVGAGIGDLLLLVGSSTATDGGAGTAGGRRRGGAARANTDRSGRGGGGGGTRRRLFVGASLAMLSRISQCDQSTT